MVVKMKKKVSIIVPVYNAVAYIRRCMGSLLAQTYENTEILIVDDGSTDDTGRICDEYGAEYEKVRVFHMSCDGVSAARNRGLAEAAGEYITFVDADDCPAKDMVEHLVEILEQTESDVAGCSYQKFYTEEEAERIRNSSMKAGNVRAGNRGVDDDKTDIRVNWQPEILEGAAFIEKGILKSDTRCWSKLYKREGIGSLRFDTGLTIGEDMLFLLELAKAGKKFCRSTYKGYGYFINEKGAMMRAFKDSYMDQITCWQKALALISAETPSLVERAEVILLISVMLVAGKLAQLPAVERKKKRAYAEKCHKLAVQYGKKKAVFRQLDRGYQIKVSMYRYMPGMYMRLYHFMKGR